MENSHHVQSEKVPFSHQQPSRYHAVHSSGHKKSVQFSNANDFFEISKNAWTPSLDTVTPVYRNPNERNLHSVAPPSSLSRPNYEDLLKRVSIVIHQHIQKCEHRLALVTEETAETGLFHTSKMNLFAEEHYVTPQYVYHFVRAPISRLGFLYGIRKLDPPVKVPDLNEVHTFLRDLFLQAQLSAECSVVCLIYVERLMELAHVPLVGKTWRPCVICGLLLASKVWQDLSSWNSEISQIYPQFSLEAINKLEMVFCKELGWNLYISSSQYAKYYFALRSLTEKRDFRRNYNFMMMVNAPGAKQVEERSEEIKQIALNNMTLSRSL